MNESRWTGGKRKNLSEIGIGQDNRAEYRKNIHVWSYSLEAHDYVGLRYANTKFPQTAFFPHKDQVVTL